MLHGSGGDEHLPVHLVRRRVDAADRRAVVVDEAASGVEEVDVGLGTDAGAEHVHRLGRPQIVGEQHRHEFGRGLAHARVQCPGELTAAKLDEVDPSISGAVAEVRLELGAHAWSVDDQSSPVGGGLSQ